MADTGLKPTRIDLEGWPLPDEVSIDGDYVGDDVDWDSAPGMLGYDQWKQPCRCATTGAITIATALNAGDSLDGVTLAAGDRVLVKDQGGGGIENGIWVAGTTPARAADMDEDAEVLGAVVYVIDGTANAGTGWAVANDTATIVDTDGIVWAAFGGGGGGSLATLTDVDTTGVADGDVLTYDTGTSKWLPVAPTTGGAITVMDEGGTLTAALTSLDFTGAGVTATNTGGAVTVAVSAGGGSATAEVNAAGRVYAYTNFR